MAAHKNAQKEKTATYFVALLLVIGTVAAFAVGVQSYHHRDNNDDASFNGGRKLDTSRKVLQSLCDPTRYKETCVGFLNSVTSRITNPNELVNIAFDATRNELFDVLNKITNLPVSKNDSRGEQGVGICKEVIKYSMDDLVRSISSIKDGDVSELSQLIENLKVWISGALTYQETCVDSFEDSTSDVRQKIYSLLRNSKKMTGDALDIISKLNMLDTNTKSNSEPKVSKSSNLPTWINDERRNIMNLSTQNIHADAVVAKDGSGQFKTIMEAVNQVPKNNVKAFVIYIKEGVYQETVLVDKDKTDVIFIGDGPNKTKISGNKNFADGYQTYKTATVEIAGDGFMAKDIGFENTAGPTKHQAVAIRVVSDFTTFYNCQFDGYQDTLYAVRSRQFYSHCTIVGTIDFIFGDAMAIFQNSKIIIKKPLPNQQCIVTAQGRQQADGPGAFIFQNCTITAEPNYYPVKEQNKAFLGRPWKAYSRTIFMQSFIDESIYHEGWTPWEGDFGLDTLFYAEFDNRGPGASQEKRVNWKGIKHLSQAQVEDFVVAKFFVNAESWLTTTGVPHYTGMVKN